MSQIKVSIVIPVFNEEKNIQLIYDKIVLLPCFKETDSFEIIYVNDGSIDNSNIVLRALAKNDNKVKIISFSKNFGHQAALTAGIEFSTGKAVITMDCDLQDPPDVIPEMIDKWEKGAEIVYMRRNTRKDKFFKRFTARLYYKILKKFTDLKIYGDIGDFRLLDRIVVNELLKLNEKTRYLRGMVAWLGFNYSIVDYDRPKRIHGKTSFSFLKMSRLGMSGILNFSLLPLRFGLILGLITIFTGVFFIGYITVDSLCFDKIYPLYKWLSVITFIFVGLLFILIWILGEYVGRTYDETKQRPLFIVRDKINFKE